MIAFDVVVVSHNTRSLLRECLASLSTQADTTWRAIVVDNASHDGSAAMVHSEFPRAVLIETSSNAGFAAGANRGLSLSKAKYVLLLNSDARLLPGCLVGLYRKLELEPKIGLLAPRLLNPDGSPQASCVPACFPWVYSSPSRDTALIWASAAALVVRRACLEAIGGLDEQFFYTGEDYDWGLRARKGGWKVAFSYDSEVVHHGGASSAENPHEAARGLHLGRQYFYAKHFGPLGLPYARLHSGIEILGHWLASSKHDRAFWIALLRRTLRFRPEIRRG